MFFDRDNFCRLGCSSALASSSFNEPIDHIKRYQDEQTLAFTEGSEIIWLCGCSSNSSTLQSFAQDNLRCGCL